MNRIGREAFYGCSALKDFTVGDSVEVGELAFEYTSLTEGIETLLPESVEDTGASASGMLAGGGKIIPVNEEPAQGTHQRLLRLLSIPCIS